MKFGANLINERPTKKGVRFSILDALWDGFKKLIDKVDEVYEGIA